MTTEHAELLGQLSSLLGKYKGSIQGIERSKSINSFLRLDDINPVFRDGQLNVSELVCADIESLINEALPQEKKSLKVEKRVFMIQTLQEALICISDLRGELYEVTTADYKQYDGVCNDLCVMIGRLQAMGDEGFHKIEAVKS